jgi:uncharacterized membrane protein YecN with MAPEG domain
MANMQIEVTLIYTLALALLLLILSIRVLDLRQSPVTRFLHNKNRMVNPETLQLAIRGHGNLTDYAPLFLLLLLIAEINDSPKSTLHAAAALFSLGRLFHGVCFCFLSKGLVLRIAGMALTFTGYIMIMRVNLTALLK